MKSGLWGQHFRWGTFGFPRSKRKRVEEVDRTSAHQSESDVLMRRARRHCFLSDLGSRASSAGGSLCASSFFGRKYTRAVHVGSTFLVRSVHPTKREGCGGEGSFLVYPTERPDRDLFVFGRKYTCAVQVGSTFLVRSVRPTKRGVVVAVGWLGEGSFDFCSMDLFRMDR